MHLILTIALWVVGINIALCGTRAVLGPTVFDRAVALDAVALNFVCVVLLESMRLGTGQYTDAAIALALVGFIGPVVLAAYLEELTDD